MFVSSDPTVDRMFMTTHLSDHVQDHMISQLNHKGLALCLDATVGIKAHLWVLVNSHGTPMPAREGCGLQQHQKTQTLTRRRNRRNLATRTRSGTNREPQEVPWEIQQEIPQENCEKHPDNMFKVII